MPSGTSFILENGVFFTDHVLTPSLFQVLARMRLGGDAGCGMKPYVIATVPKVAQCDWVDAALRAKPNCPSSRALNAKISMRAQLSPQSKTKI